VVDSEQQQAWIRETSQDHDSDVDSKSGDKNHDEFDRSQNKNGKSDTTTIPITTACTQSELQHAPLKKIVVHTREDGDRDVSKGIVYRPKKSHLLTPPLKKRQLFTQTQGAFKIYEEPMNSIPSLGHASVPPLPVSVATRHGDPARDTENLDARRLVGRQHSQEPPLSVDVPPLLRTALATVSNSNSSSNSSRVATELDSNKSFIQTNNTIVANAAKGTPMMITADESNREQHVRHAILTRSLQKDMMNLNKIDK